MHSNNMVCKKKGVTPSGGQLVTFKNMHYKNSIKIKYNVTFHKICCNQIGLGFIIQIAYTFYFEGSFMVIRPSEGVTLYLSRLC